MKQALSVLGLITSLLVACGSPPADSVATPVETVANASSGGKRVVGYFTQWGIYGVNYQVSDIPGDKLTHLNYAFSNISADGRCITGDAFADFDHTKGGVPSNWNPGALRGNAMGFKMLKQRHPNLKILISIGGWTWSKSFSQVAGSDGSRRSFVQSCIDLWIKGQFPGVDPANGVGIFDGIDVDWEYPVSGGLPTNITSPADRQNYTLLMREFRSQLNALSAQTGKPYLLTIASGASPDLLMNRQETRALSDTLDWINVMSYDYHGGWEATTNFHSGLYRTDGDPLADTGFYTDSSISKMLELGVPASKIVMGVGFYGRGWGNVPATNNGLFQPGQIVRGNRDDTESTGVFTYDYIVSSMEQAGYGKFRHPQSKQAYVYSPSTRIWVAYDDPQSMADKAAYVDTKGLGGMMFWELSQDKGALLNAIASNLGSGGGGGGGGGSDTTPPTVSLSSSSTSVTTAGSIALSAQAADNVGVSKVEFYRGATKLGEDSSVPYSQTLSLSSADNGTLSLTAKAFDAAGNATVSSAVNVTVNISGGGGGGGGGGSATAWAANVAYKVNERVSYAGKIYTCRQAHTSLVGWEPPNVPALWLEVGNDSGGGGGGSDTTAPSVTLSSSNTNVSSAGAITLTANATDDVGVSKVEFYRGASKLGEDSSAPFAQSVNLSSADNGSVGFTAKAFDAAGNTATSSLVTVTVNIGAGGGGGGNTGSTVYAPYYYTWGWGNSDAYRFGSLVDMRSKTNLNAVTLAFALADPWAGCAIITDPNSRENWIETRMRDDIAAFKAGGGQVIVSFGGAEGRYIESDDACRTENDLYAALEGFVNRTGLTDLDFDVEQAGVMNDAVNTKRARALARLQTRFPNLNVSFTLAATPKDKWGTPGGLTPAGLGVVRAAVQNGVKIRHVNLMTMDYGGYYSTGNRMGDLAVNVIEESFAQLKTLLPASSDAQIWNMLGATPMIGQNDVASEVFTLEDAQTLVNFARQKKLGLLSFWAIHRDQPCPPSSSILSVCSQKNTAPFQYHDIFKTAR